MWKFIQYGVAPEDEQQMTEIQELENPRQSLLQEARMTYNTDFAEIFIEETKH
jgi:hypothetical protein